MIRKERYKGNRVLNECMKIKDVYVLFSYLPSKKIKIIVFLPTNKIES